MKSPKTVRRHDGGTWLCGAGDGRHFVAKAEVEARLPVFGAIEAFDFLFRFRHEADGHID